MGCKMLSHLRVRSWQSHYETAFLLAMVFGKVNSFYIFYLQKIVTFIFQLTCFKIELIKTRNWKEGRITAGAQAGMQGRFQVMRDAV